MIKGTSANVIEVFPGVRRRRLVATTQVYQMTVELSAGSSIPLHQHPQEQISHVVSGRVRFQVGEAVVEAGPGESLAIPGGTPHAVLTLEPGLLVETFAPPRADYLAADGD